MSTVDTNTNTTTSKNKGRRGRRQAPPRPGTAAAAQATADAAESEDDSDNDGDGDDKPKTGRRKASIPAHIRKASVFRRLGDRLQTAVHGKSEASTEMDGWVEHDDLADAQAKAEHAQKLLTEAAELLEGLGTDFNPLPKSRRRSSGRAKIEKGSVVRLKDKFRDPEKGYGDLLTEDEMDKLTVRDVRGQKLVLTTDDGGKLFLPKGNVELVKGDTGSDSSDDGDE